MHEANLAEANLGEANRRPRCTEPSCAVRYRGGPDRACPLHVDEMAELAARMDAAADGLMAAPGERDGGRMVDTDGDGSEGCHPGAA